MLGDKEAIAMLAVKDIDAARKFYEGKLGLKVVSQMGGEVVTYRTGKTTMNVYRSKHAGTNKATAANWDVGDSLETIVRTLREKGVTFEHYDDMPGVTRQGDLHAAGDMRMAWFKDPDGNIHGLNGR